MKIGIILEYTGSIAAPGSFADACALESKKSNDRESTILTGQGRFGLNPRKDLAQ